MNTTLDCLPCFFQQTLQAARLSTNDPQTQKEILDAIASILPQLDFNLSPPENSIRVYDTIAQISGCNDPFITIKESSNRLGRTLSRGITADIQKSTDPLYTACLYSVAGNIIDYGANHTCDQEEVIRSCRHKQFRLNHYKKFRKHLSTAQSLLYLGDNSGEIVFDSLVIKQLQHHYPDLDITFVVKQRPIINDALRADATFCGLTEICTVIDNGTGCPGSPLKQCSAEFNDYFNQADLIISKGQGNFETLSEQKGLYFLMICKCPVVGAHLGQLSGAQVNLGDLIFYKS